MMQAASRELLVVLLVALNVVVQSEWTKPVAAVKGDELNYDPEYNSNGIIAELEVSRLVPAPANKRWRYDDHQDDENYLVLPAKPPAERRSDIEDEDEDERDEEKSGSSAHGSYSESPAYGESAKAAQDGDDIENFFDTHLGPQDAAEVSERDEAPEQASSGSRGKLVDPDDQYDTAASSPLTEIFQNLLKVHRRPIVITTSEKAPPTSSASSSPLSSSSSLSGMPSSSRPIASSTMLEPSSSGSSATSLAGIPFVSGSPFLDQSHQYSGQSSDHLASSGSSQHDDAGNFVREVYIARRPSLFAPFTAKVVEQQAQQPQQPQHHFQPNQWRGIPSNNNNDVRVTDPEDRQPVSASYNSYSTGQDYPMPETPGNSNDEQTVSYGLSFGSSLGSGGGSSLFPSLLASLGGGHSSSSSVDQSAASPPPPPQMNYNSGYNSMANSMRQPVSAPVSYQSNYRQPYYQSSMMDQSANQMYGQKYNPYQQQMLPTNGNHNYNPVAGFNRQQQTYGSSNNYARNRGAAQAADESMDAKNWIIRQHLLAKVDQQLKNNPYYRQNLAQASSQQFPITHMNGFQNQFQQQTRTSGNMKQVVDSDIAMFNSMHSVTDPHSTFTTSTSLMSEPHADNSLRKGISLDPSSAAGAGNVVSSTRLIATHKPVPSSTKCSESASSAAHQLNPSSTQQTSTILHKSNQQQQSPNHDLLRTRQPLAGAVGLATSKPLIRVRREDADDRENDDVDDDGVWVDDEEDDDNKQTASDVNETSQEPQEENQDNSTEQTDSGRYVSPSGYIGHPHSYEVAL